MIIKEDRLIELYLDWFNNFLTVSAFAEYYGFTPTQASNIIDKGKELNNEWRTIQSYGSFRGFI